MPEAEIVQPPPSSLAPDDAPRAEPPRPAAAPLPAVAPAPVVAADAPAPPAAAPVTAFALLTAPRGMLVAGQIVTGPAAAVAALIAAGGARAATAGEVERARPFINPLPVS